MGGSFDAFGFAFLRFAVAAAAFSPFLKVCWGSSWALLCGAVNQCMLRHAGAAVVCLLGAAGDGPPCIHPTRFLSLCWSAVLCQRRPTGLQFGSHRAGLGQLPSLRVSPMKQAASGDNRILKAGVEIGAWTAMGYIFQSAGLLTTDASRASFLSTFTVLVGGRGGFDVIPSCGLCPAQQCGRAWCVGHLCSP